MNWVLIRSRYMGIIKAKSSKNRRKSKSHAKTEETRSTTRRTAVPRAHDRASLHHGPCAPPPRAVRLTTASPWWPLSRAVSTLPHCYVLTSFGPRFGPWIFMFWASFAALLSLHASTSFNLDSTHTFLLQTWLESYKSAINTQQAKTERNRRNRGVNYKIKPIYPQE